MAPTGDVPILLLDVDGVLNAPASTCRRAGDGARSTGSCCLGPDRHGPAARPARVRPSGDPVAHHLDDERRPVAGRADGAAARAEDPRPGRRGTDRLPRAARGWPGWWKLDLAREAAEAEPDRRIIWIDDDLAEQAADTGEWLAAHPHVLVVAPDLFAGLTHEQLDEIEAWL